MEHLQSLKKDTHTLIFYEAPHKLVTTLHDIRDVLGNRRLSLCRELTKIHQEVIRTDFDGAIALYEEKAPKGEFVLIVEGASPEEPEKVTLEEAVDRACRLAEAGAKQTDAAKQIAAETGFKKSEIYAAMLRR